MDVWCEQEKSTKALLQSLNLILKCNQSKVDSAK